jgi:hypothetical protein
MNPIKVGRGHCGNEKLRAVGILASVGHRQHARFVVSVLEVLICELTSVDRLSARAVAVLEVTALEHEAFDDAVELASLEVEWFVGGRAFALLTGAQCTEVLRRFGDSLGKKLHRHLKKKREAGQKVCNNIYSTLPAALPSIEMSKNTYCTLPTAYKVLSRAQK